MIIRCARCGLVQPAPAGQAGAERCAGCGAPLVQGSAATSDVIDVQAEVLSTRELDEPISPVEVLGPERVPPQQPRVYTWNWGSQTRGGQGCCSIGCLLLIVLVLLLIRSCG